MDTKSVRSTSGVKLLDFDSDDKVAAVVIPTRISQNPTRRGNAFAVV
jgi:hypothetical protein